MNLKEVLHVVGVILGWVAVAMLPCVALSVGEGLLVAWLVATGTVAVVGAVLWMATPRVVSINPREAIAIVGVGWLTVVVLGAIPFLATGTVPGPTEALFESVSGFTTTGATIFSEIEVLPRSILLWRSLSHWLGGMGIIVLGVAILPLLGVGGAQLFRAEAPGIVTDRLTPRIASTARLLWAVYAGLTVFLAVVYLVLGMSVFDAVNHAMSALATGGFSTRTASLGAFSASIQWVTIVFMFAAGVNFTLHLRLFSGRLTAWFTDPEWRWYFASTVGVLAIVFVALGTRGYAWSAQTLREALFSTVAVHSSTGFGIADFAAWPAVCQALLLGLMFVGAMGGSTGGGFKMVRAAVVFEHVKNEIRKALHPRAVTVTRLGHRAVKGDVVLNVLAFLGMYMMTHAIGTLLLTALGSDLVTALSAAIAAMSSIGPGLGEVGPAAHYGHLTPAAQVVLSVLMLLGRLEFYTLLVLVIPSAWMAAGGHR